MFYLALIGTQTSGPPIEALPQESVSYDSAEWPIRQTNHERSGGGACSSRCFAAQRDGHCSKRERPWDAGSYGRRLAPRGPRAAKLSAVWRPYPGTCRLLPARGKQQVCSWFGTFGPAGRMDQATLARCWKYSRSIYSGRLLEFKVPNCFSR